MPCRTGNRPFLGVLKLPWLIRWGGAVITTGGLVDVIYHVAPSPGGGTGVGLAGHAITLTGMVITIAGVVRVGLSQRHHQPQ